MSGSLLIGGRWFAIGMLVGAGTGGVISQVRPPVAPENVVVLRSVKRITLVKFGVTAAELAKEVGKQCGKIVHLDTEYSDNKKTYSFVLSAVPLESSLHAAAYMMKGRCSREADGYILRPRGNEDAPDADTIAMAVERMKDYLGDLDPSDPSLTAEQSAALKQYQHPSATDVGPYLGTSPDDEAGWQVLVLNSGLTVIGPPTTNGAQRISRGVGWAQGPITHVGGRK